MFTAYALVQCIITMSAASCADQPPHRDDEIYLSILSCQHATEYGIVRVSAAESDSSPPTYRCAVLTDLAKVAATWGRDLLEASKQEQVHIIGQALKCDVEQLQSASNSARLKWSACAPTLVLSDQVNAYAIDIVPIDAPEMEHIPEYKTNYVVVLSPSGMAKYADFTRDTSSCYSVLVISGEIVGVPLFNGPSGELVFVPKIDRMRLDELIQRWRDSASRNNGKTGS